MAIRAHLEYEKPNLFRRFCRWLCGGQDVVAVVFIAESGYVMTQWFTGVDITNPADTAKCTSVTNKISDH